MLKKQVTSQEGLEAESERLQIVWFNSKGKKIMFTINVLSEQLDKFKLIK